MLSQVSGPHCSLF